jgi:hypothetical protein
MPRWKALAFNSALAAASSEDRMARQKGSIPTDRRSAPRAATFALRGFSRQ